MTFNLEEFETRFTGAHGDHPCGNINCELTAPDCRQWWSTYRLEMSTEMRLGGFVFIPAERWRQVLNLPKWDGRIR